MSCPTVDNCLQPFGCRLSGDEAGEGAPVHCARHRSPSRPRCTAWCSNTQRRSLPRPKTLPAPTCSSSSRTSSTPFSNAASWPTGSCACAAGIAATTSCWPSVARAEAFALVRCRAHVADGCPLGRPRHPAGDSSGDPPTRAAAVGCVRVVGGPTEAARRQGITRRRRHGAAHFGWAMNAQQLAGRSQPASKGRFKRVGRCVPPLFCRVLGAVGKKEGAFEKPVPCIDQCLSRGGGGQ